MKYSALYLTILVILLLLPAAFLKKYIEEPYPAILLPSAATLIKTDVSTVSFVKMHISGIDSGNWRRIKASEFLRPIPSQYLYALSRRNFGLSDSDAALDNSEIKKWIQERLKSLGLNTDKFKFTKKRVTIDKISGNELSSELIDEKIYQLH